MGIPFFIVFLQESSKLHGDYSFKHIRFNKHIRLKKDFWDIQKLNNAYNLFSDELDKCKISTLYLHGPPKYILDYKYLQNFSIFCSPSSPQNVIGLVASSLTSIKRTSFLDVDISLTQNLALLNLS